MPQASDLRQAVIENDIEQVRTLLESDPWLVAASTTNPGNETALHVAADLGLTDIAVLLLSCKATVDAKDDLGQTPLHRAAWAGKVPMAGLLLEHGAELVARDITGRTILQPPSGEGSSDELRRFLRDTITIHQAAALGDIEIAAYILDSKPDLVFARDEKDDYEGYTPLHWAVESGQLPLVEMLIGRGADINAIDEYGYTPLTLALEIGYQKTAAFLRECGDLGD